MISGKKENFLLILIAILIFVFISTIIGEMGIVGEIGKNIRENNLKYFGAFAYIYPIGLIIASIKLYKDFFITIRKLEIILSFILISFVLVTLQVFVFEEPYVGIMGNKFVDFLSPLIGMAGVLILWFVLLIIATSSLFNVEIGEFISIINYRFNIIKDNVNEMQTKDEEKAREIEDIIKQNLNETKEQEQNIEEKEEESVAENLEQREENLIEVVEEKQEPLVGVVEESHGYNETQTSAVTEENRLAEDSEEKEIVVFKSESDFDAKETAQKVEKVKVLAENKKLVDEATSGKAINLDRKSFRLPPIDIFQKPKSVAKKIQEEEIDEQAINIIDKLNVFKIVGDIERTYSGPIVTTFEFKPAPNVKVGSIQKLEDDLAMALKAKSIRIQAPIPGKDVVGIEIPNREIETIYFRELLESPIFQNSASPLSIILGKDIVGNPFVTDLRKLPHLLIAGTTGSGKSVGLNAMILSLLYKNTPDTLKLILVDPKMLEFSIYADIPHLLTPIITEPKKAITALNNVVAEMRYRNNLMSQHKVKNIDSFNEKAKDLGLERLPYIVVIIDELADLMMTSGKEVELSINTIAAVARAAGIHLIIATQRPSTNVVTGLIKANMPSRISYRVGTKIDSRVVLDENGAENLVGRGDMLFTPPGSSALVRLHAPWSTEEEIEEVAEFLKAEQDVVYNEHFLMDPSQVANSPNISSDGLDELYADAVDIMVNDNKTSISYLQRKLNIGYNRAATIVEQMEEQGFLSAPNNRGIREILQ